MATVFSDLSQDSGEPANVIAGNAIAGQLGHWVARLSTDQIPKDVVGIAWRCLIDTIAVAAAGSSTPVAAPLRQHVSVHYGSGPCTVLGTSLKASPVGAALANGAAAHALDFDDTSYAGVVHGSAVVLPAVLAAAERADASGIEFLEAFVAGSEVVYALGLTLTSSHYLRGWWATSTLGAIGAAAGAAKVLKLEPEEITAAIALAAAQASGMIAMFGSDAKPVIAGQAARLGVESALLAAEGLSVPLSVFEDRRGFLNLMNDGHQDPSGYAELGRTWRLLTPGIVVKRAPVCSAAQAAIEATEQLIASHDLDRSLIASVKCEVSHLVRISLVHDEPATPPQSQFSMPFAIGCILAFGRLGPEQISQDVLEDKALQDAMTTVSMVEAEDLNGPDYQPRYPECARVTISMHDGKDFTAFVGAPTGMPENPMSNEALFEKYRACTAFAGWPVELAEQTLARLRNIEELASIRSLMRGEA